MILTIDEIMLDLQTKKMRNETANNILGLAQNDFNNQYHTRTLQSKIQNIKKENLKYK